MKTESLRQTVFSFSLLTLPFFGCASVPSESPQRTPAETLYVSEPITQQGLFGKSIEGPAVDRDGNLYFVHNLERGTVGTVVKMEPNGKPQMWIELPQGVVGNSIRFDREGRMFLADYKGHRIFEIDRASRKTAMFLSHKEMNQPNDFAISQTGALFMSDPSWSRKKKGNLWHSSEQGIVSELATDVKAANGIDLSPDETRLYFGESISGNIFVFNLKDGKLSDKKVFYKFAPDSIDGIRTDSQGNLYVARITKGAIDCLSPDGQLIRSTPLIGKDPTNIAFGGKDGRTVYVTVRDSGHIESFRVDFPGREWVLLHAP